ncbi:hypothetical protein [Loigolactobacillus rennini]|uniref:PepSY domain-containing protein n=1 Tax=Loigolactobacillus rennini DSM 20253 TaxID=1423796 RepID=A0A0R2CY56_9LACO|nr:hypothetical protein [Loigolactobacillus rennini]KRM93003.1 hypothetical protein FC24_GL000695 [Loigolactobacillus rennini DSM 20253]
MLTKQTRQFYFGGFLLLLGSYCSHYLWQHYNAQKPAALLAQLRKRVAHAVKVTGSWIEWQPQQFQGQTVYFGGLALQDRQKQQIAYFALNLSGQLVKLSHQPFSNH